MLKSYNNKLFVNSIIIIVILIGIASFAFAGGLYKLPRKDIEGTYLSQEEINAFINSEEGKKNQERTNKKLDDAWKDIKNVFAIEEDKYIKLSLKDIYSKSLENKYDIFKDSTFLQAFYTEYQELQKDRQLGSLMPTVLVSLEKDEILLAYKDKDGSNVLKRSVLTDGKWEHESSKKAGKAILEFND